MKVCGYCYNEADTYEEDLSYADGFGTVRKSGDELSLCCSEPMAEYESTFIEYYWDIRKLIGKEDWFLGKPEDYKDYYDAGTSPEEVAEELKDLWIEARR